MVSESLRDVIDDIDRQVLILVLMADGLWVLAGIAGAAVTAVLILVLMADGLWDSYVHLSGLSYIVLILVLMADGLWDVEWVAEGILTGRS